MSAENILRLQVPVCNSWKAILVRDFEFKEITKKQLEVFKTFFVKELQCQGQILDDKAGFKFRELSAIFNVVK